MAEERESVKTLEENVESPEVSNTIPSESAVEEQLNPLQKGVLAFRASVNNVVGEIAPRWKAYRNQWPKTFLTWFLVLLALSLLVWRFLPGDAGTSIYTPAQGLIIPLSVFGGPAVIAAFIASHSGLEWYTNTVTVKGIGLLLLDYFFKFRALVLRTLTFGKEKEEIPTDGIIDLPFPGLGYQAFHDRYFSKNQSANSEHVLEAVAQYQLSNLGSLAINFLTVYLLIKLPAIVLWEAISLALEWGVYWVGFRLAKVPFPALTFYHWELFIAENLAVAVIILFQKVKIDIQRPILQPQTLSSVVSENTNIPES